MDGGHIGAFLPSKSNSQDISKYIYKYLIQSFSGKRFIMCGRRDTNNKIDSAIFKTSCSKAVESCGTATCAREYMKDAFKDRLYKFCGSDMNFIVTPHFWSAWAYSPSLAKHTSGGYHCVAFCNL